MTGNEEKEALQELYNWQHIPGADWFTAQLFNLWMKADFQNKAKLARGFPIECRVIEQWYNSPDPHQFFRDRGFKE